MRMNKNGYSLSMTDKKRTEIDWQDVRVFLALARHGSLSAAARALSVNHATISRRIQSLESSMGEKLVERRPEGYVLTSAGTRAMEVASEMESAAQTLGRGDINDSLKGLVRVNAPPGLAQGFLIAHLAKLPSLHPGLDIDLAIDLRSISLDRHQADIAIRISRPLDGDFIARPLGYMDFGFYGSDEICLRVEEGGPPSFITFDEENSDIPDAVWLAKHFPRTRISFRTNNHVAQAQAAKCGAGLALLPHYIGRKESGLRQCQWQSEMPPSREIWLLMRRQDRKNQLVRTVADYLVQQFECEQDLFRA